MTAPRPSTYAYTRLPNGPWIRLLRLLPAWGVKNQIRFVLQPALLSGPTRYEALSYAWEGQVPDQVVNCDNQQLLVTQTCLAALRRLRLRTRTRTLWIDGICIDQSSTKEKNHQVAMMRDVYSCADRVVVWLGEDREGVGMLFDCLRRHDRLNKIYQTSIKMYNLKHKSSWGWPILKFIQRDWAQREEELSKHGIGLWRLSEVLPWFARLWTLQEVAFARQAIIIHGSTSMDYEGFVGTLLARMEERWTDYLTGIPMNSQVADEWYFLSLRCQARRQIHRDRVTDPIQLMRWSAFGSATVPSDKVYAIYGLLQNQGTISLPAPDYTLDVDVVYWKTCVILTKVSGTLLLLLDIQGEPRSHTANIPSWVPDFNRSAMGFNKIAVSGTSYGATAGSSAEFAFAGEDDFQITTKAQLVGSIATTVDSNGLVTAFNQLTTEDERVSAIFNVLRCFQHWIRATDALESYPTGDEPIDALLNVMYLGYGRPAYEESLLEELVDLIRGIEASILDVAAYFSHQRERVEGQRPAKTHLFWEGDYNVPGLYLKRLLSWQSCSLADVNDDEPDEQDEFLFLALLKSWDLCSGSGYFSTEDGYLGIAPAPRQVGDTVALIPGLDFPMVLRKLDNRRFRVIGPAYIWGMMDGEAWEAESLEDLILE